MKIAIVQRTLAVLLAMALAASALPMGAMADHEETTAPTMTLQDADAPDAEQESAQEEAPAASVGETGYPTLEEAVDAAAAGQTVHLLMDVTLDESLTVTKNLTLELGGRTVTGTISVSSGILTLGGSGLVSGEGTTPTVRVGDDSAQGAAGLIVETGVTVSASAGIGVKLSGGAALTVKGKITAAHAAISGSAGQADTTIRIEDGAQVISTGSAAVYQPQGGSLTVAGGTIKGVTAIEAKAGTVRISGSPLVEATGTMAHSPSGSAPSTTGYALAAVEHESHGGNPTFTVSGGSFKGEVGTLTDSANSAGGGSISLSGGRYTTDVSRFTAAGKVCLSAEGDYPYIIGTEIAQLELTVTEPAVGAAPSDAAVLPADAGYTAGKVTWSRRTGENQGVYMEDGETFAPGKDYRCTVTLTPKEGFAFAGSVTAPQGWTPVRNDDGTVTLTSKTFKLEAQAEPTQITKISNGTVPRVPEPGEKPQTPDQITAGDGYKVESVTWKDKKGNVLAQGKTFAPHTIYTAIVQLTAGEGRVFADKQTLKKGLPNGWSVDAVKDEGKTAVIFKTFAETGHLDADRDNNCDTCGQEVNSIPYTGDVSRVGLWTASMLAAAACLTGIGFVLYRRKKLEG